MSERGGQPYTLTDVAQGLAARGVAPDDIAHALAIVSRENGLHSPSQIGNTATLNQSEPPSVAALGPFQFIYTGWSDGKGANPPYDRAQAAQSLDYTLDWVAQHNAQTGFLKDLGPWTTPQAGMSQQQLYGQLTAPNSPFVQAGMQAMSQAGIVGGSGASSRTYTTTATPQVTSTTTRPAPEEVGPNGRTVSQIAGTAYLSPEERAFYWQQKSGTPPPGTNTSTQPAPLSSGTAALPQTAGNGATVAPGQQYSEGELGDEQRYNFLRGLDYNKLAPDAKAFLNDYGNRQSQATYGGGRNAPRIASSITSPSVGDGGLKSSPLPDTLSTDSAPATIQATPSPYFSSAGPYGNQTTLNNATAQNQYNQNYQTAVTGQAQAAQAQTAANAGFGASANLGAMNQGDQVAAAQAGNEVQFATGGMAMVGPGKARMKLQPQAAVGSAWPPPGGFKPTLRVPERILGVGADTGQVHFTIGDNPNGPELMTITPPPGDVNGEAHPGSMRHGGMARIGRVAPVAPPAWQPTGDNGYGNGFTLPNWDPSLQPQAQDLRNASPYDARAEGTISYAGGGDAFIGGDGSDGPPLLSNDTYNTNRTTVYAPPPASSGVTPYAPTVFTGSNPAQGQLDARNADLAANRATIPQSQAVIDANRATLPYSQSVLDANRTLYGAQGAVTDAQQGAIGPQMQKIAADSATIQARMGQTQAQRGYIGQEQTANAQAQAEEQAIQAAHANTADRTAVAQAQAAQNSANSIYQAAGVTPAEMVNDTGAPMPVGVRAKIRTQEDILKEKSAQAENLRQFQLQGAKLAVDLLGTNVQAASDAAAKVGLTVDQAQLLVQQAQVGESRARIGVAQAGNDLSQSQLGAQEAGYNLDQARLAAQAAGYDVTGSQLPPSAGLVMYTDPTTGSSQWVTQKEADDLQYAYNKAQSVSHGTGLPGVPFSNYSQSQLLDALATNPNSVYAPDYRNALSQRYGMSDAQIADLVSRTKPGVTGNQSISRNLQGLSAGQIVTEFVKSVTARDGNISRADAINALVALGVSQDAANTRIDEALTKTKASNGIDISGISATR